MPFPLSVQGEFIVSGLDARDIRDMLVSEAFALLWMRSDDVTFDDRVVISKPSWKTTFITPGGIWGNWHPMHIFDEVRLDIGGTSSEALVHYEMSTRRFLIIAAVVGFIVDLLFSLSPQDNPIDMSGYATAIPTPIFTFMVVFSIIFGFNFVYCGLFGPMWLRSQLRRRCSA